jgi:hypothetical protein
MNDLNRLIVYCKTGKTYGVAFAPSGLFSARQQTDSRR